MFSDNINDESTYVGEEDNKSQFYFDEKGKIIAKAHIEELMKDNVKMTYQYHLQNKKKDILLKKRRISIFSIIVALLSLLNLFWFSFQNNIILK